MIQSLRGGRAVSDEKAQPATASLPRKESSGATRGYASAMKSDLAVDHHVLDTAADRLRLLGRGGVEHRDRIEYAHVGEPAGAQIATLVQVEPARAQSRHLVHSHLEREELKLATVAA
jgi:hypothetical protein